MKLSMIFVAIIALGSESLWAAEEQQDRFFPSEEEKNTPFFDRESWVSTTHIAYNTHAYPPQHTHTHARVHTHTHFLQPPWKDLLKLFADIDTVLLDECVAGHGIEMVGAFACVHVCTFMCACVCVRVCEKEKERGCCWTSASPDTALKW